MGLSGSGVVSPAPVGLPSWPSVTAEGRDRHPGSGGRSRSDRVSGQTAADRLAREHQLASYPGKTWYQHMSCLSCGAKADMLGQ